MGSPNAEPEDMIFIAVREMKKGLRAALETSGDVFSEDALYEISLSALVCLCVECALSGDWTEEELVTLLRRLYADAQRSGVFHFQTRPN